MYPHYGVPVVVGHLEQQVVAGYPGVVYQDGWRAEPFCGLLDCGVDLLGVADIRTECDGFASGVGDRVHRGLRVLLGEVEYRDRVPFSCQASRGGSADSTGRAVTIATRGVWGMVFPPI